jgi:aminotransferase
MAFGAAKMGKVPFSGIRKVFELARKLELEGRDIVHLEIGRPDFDTPTHIKKAAIDAIEAGDVHYTSNYGTIELRTAIADYLSKAVGQTYNPENEVIVTVGAAEAIFDTFIALLDAGDEVLVPDPAWANYSAAAVMAGAEAVRVPLRESNGFEMDPDEIAKMITPRTRGLVIVSPHNPTGTVQSVEVLEAIAELAQKHNLFVLSDEIYDQILFDGRKHVSIASIEGMRCRTVIVNGFSKAYSMTGWRIGYLAAAKPLVDVINRVHQHNTTCASSFVQAGALAALTGPQDCVREMVAEFERRRNLVINRLEEIPLLSCLKPQGAFYAFINMKETGLEAADLGMRLLQEAGVALVPGSVFGAQGEGFLRLSFASSYESLEKAMDRIGQFMTSLQANK